MSRLTFLALAALLTGCGSRAVAGDKNPTPAAATVGSMYDLSLTALDGSVFEPKSLQGKAVLFVNVASKCGYTGQYEQLQAIYDKYRAKGFVIVGVPSNQFMGQEPGSPEQIATFCKMNYGVTFPLLEKQDVNGKNRTPLYHYLVNSEVGGGSKVGWNFEKFLVSPTGEVVGRWASKVVPDSADITTAIERVLPNKG